MEITDEAIEADILYLNRTAMSSLKDQNFSKALKSLKRASVLINNVEKNDKRMKLQGITLNNFGCFYKRSKMPNVALKYLNKACSKEKEGEVDSVGVAATHLNMCAIYSELGKHDLALEEGLLALDLMKSSQEHSPNFISTLVIAYHNTGVEYEYLKNFQDAFQCYKTAWETASQYLGPTHPLTQSMHSNTSQAEKKLQDSEMRQTKDLFKKEPISRVTRTRFKSADKRPKSRSAEKSHRKKVSTQREDSKVQKIEVSQYSKQPVRFLTGERLQPMFKNELRVQSLPRGSIRNKHESFKISEKKTVLTNGMNKFKMRIRKTYKDKEETEEKLREKEKLALNIQEIDSLIEESVQKIGDSRGEGGNEKAAVKIQKIFRGFKVRKSIQDKKDLDDEALEAIRDMDLFKKEKRRKKELREIEDDAFEAIKDMDLFKKEKKRKNGLEEIEEVGLDVIPEIPDPTTPISERLFKDPIIGVQGLIRGYLTRKHISLKSQAAITIQKHVRRHQVHKIFKQIKEAILFIQSEFRKYTIRKLHQPIN